MRISSIASSSPCLRCRTLSVCVPRKSLTCSVKRFLSASNVVCACVRNAVSCSCSCAMRSCCALTHDSKALRVLPPKSPSLVTPITAWPSCTFARSLLCNLFVVTTIVSSNVAILVFSDSIALVSISTSLMRCSYSFACMLMRSKSASNCAICSL